MSRSLLVRVVLVFLTVALGMSKARAQQNNSTVPRITGFGNATVIAHADTAILILSVRSSATLAVDAATEVAQKDKAVEAALQGLGYSADSYKIGTVVFTPAGGPYYNAYHPSVAEIQADQYVYVFYPLTETSNPADLNEKIASAVDALSKAGTSPAGDRRNPQEASFVIYALKNAAQYEAQARTRALNSARANAHEIAAEMNIQLGDLFYARTNQLQNGFPQYGEQFPASALNDLPYHYYSTYGDHVEVKASAGLAYRIAASR